MTVRPHISRQIHLIGADRRTPYLATRRSRADSRWRGRRRRSVPQRTATPLRISHRRWPEPHTSIRPAREWPCRHSVAGCVPGATYNFVAADCASNPTGYQTKEPPERLGSVPYVIHSRRWTVAGVFSSSTARRVDPPQGLPICTRHRQRGVDEQREMPYPLTLEAERERSRASRQRSFAYRDDHARSEDGRHRQHLRRKSDHCDLSCFALPYDDIELGESGDVHGERELRESAAARDDVHELHPRRSGARGGAGYLSEYP